MRPVPPPASRRAFLKYSALAAAASVLSPSCRTAPRRRTLAPGERMRLGVIGVGNRGHENLDGVRSEDIVAICDVDRRYLDAVKGGLPDARTYFDFREMLAAETLDGVVVSTADHTHAVATAMALRKGCHVYCEKPLTHTVSEARFLTELASDVEAVTQMGTQIHALPNYRRVVELVRSGAIGPVREVVVFCNGKTWSGGERPSDAPPVPDGLRYDLWLGPAEERPYHPDYLPANWRRWWAFGGGTLADMSCHYTDLAFWALGLDYPVTVEAEGPPPHPETTPPWLVVRYEFPAGTMPARDGFAAARRPGVKLSWYDGGKKPEALAPLGLAAWENGVLFIGDGGFVVSDYDRHVIGPEKDFAGFEPPAKTIPDSVGHYKEWIDACKSGGETTCPFSYSGRLTETVLLGNVAYRTGKKLEWDWKRLRATNAPEADRFIETRYRAGWTL